MERAFSLPAVNFDVPRAFNILYCEEKLPYTFHFEFPLSCIDSIREVVDKVSNTWGHRYILEERKPENWNQWLSELIHYGTDTSGIWRYSFNIGNTEFETFEMHRRNPSINVSGFIKKLKGKTTCNVYITLFDPPEIFFDIWKGKMSTEVFEVLPSFELFRDLNDATPLKPTISPGRFRYILPAVLPIWLFRSIIFRSSEPIHVPSYMYSDPNASWKMNLVSKDGNQANDTKIVKETIKTSRGTFNITRPATKKEIKEQKKAAKLVKQEKLQNRLDRQKVDLEKLKDELEKTQKALSLATESSKVAANRQKKELEQINRKLNQLRRSKDSELALKDAEIDEIQKIADEIIAAEDSTKQQLQNASWQIENLNAQVQGLRQQKSTSGIIALPSEQEKFPGEFEVAIMSAIHFAFDNAPIKANSYSQRSRDIWKSFIQTNSNAETAYRNYKANVSTLLATIKKNNFWKNHSQLAPLGMTCTLHTNNHGKIRFSDGDGRYSSVVASTPSETASGPANFADELKNAFFYY